MNNMQACVVVTESHLRKAKSIIEKFEIAEIRLDICQYSDNDIKDLFSSHPNLIATYRSSPSEISKKKDQLYLAIDSGASYIDLEYDLDTKTMEAILDYANEKGVKLIYSFHNFEETPSESDLIKIIDKGNEYNATYVKIATRANTKEEALRLLNLYLMYENLIAFSIGEKSKFTRISSLYLGAPFTYVYHGTERNQLAEGQLSYREYKEIMSVMLQAKKGREEQLRTTVLKFN